jgi:hypothetical protein
MNAVGRIARRGRVARPALGLGLIAAIGCTSYSGGRFDDAAHPDLATVMFAAKHPTPVGTPVATVETMLRGRRSCTDLGNSALRDLLAQAKARGAVGVKEVQFREQSKWIGNMVCRDSLFSRSVEVRGVAYSLGRSVPIPSAISIEVAKEMRPEITEAAILGAAADESIPAWVTTYVQPASLPLEALKVQWMEKPYGPGWSAESRESGRIVAVYRQQRFSLRVLVTYTREAVTARIASSKNLGQTSTHISAEATTRFHDFVATIQANLADLATRG